MKIFRVVPAGKTKRGNVLVGGFYVKKLSFKTGGWRKARWYLTQREAEDAMAEMEIAAALKEVA